MQSAPRARRLLALALADLPEAADGAASIPAAAALAVQSSLPLEVVLLGRAVQSEHIDNALRQGARAVWACTHPELSERVCADQWVAAFAAALSHPALRFDAAPTLALLPVTPVGEEIAAALAVQMDGAALGRCADISLESMEIRARRMTYGGRANLALTSAHPRCFACMRPPATPHAEQTFETSAMGRVFSIALDVVLPEAPPVREQPLAGQKRRLEGARVIVSGGRGVGGEEGFKLLDQLADCLGAAVGASLPAVDAGWASVARQVGQSGKYVSPQVYIAVGVSGTPQHLAGVDPGARIIAINKDPTADILRYAEIGVVADWREFLPLLIARLQMQAEGCQPPPA